MRVDVDFLKSELERPELHRKVLAGYEGPYSLGVGSDPCSSTPVLVLQVAGDPHQSFPAQVTVRGERVHVVVNKGFVTPRPYAAVGYR
jgi:hypothetical protein